jgi:hypothetical protein
VRLKCHPECNEGSALWLKCRSLAALGMTTASLGMTTAALGMTTAALGTLAGACASVARPPGGPVDSLPPQVVSASIDTNATGVKAGKLEIHFDEVVAERPAAGGGGSGPVTLEAIVLVSPSTGSAKVEWHRESISIEPRGGFKPNTTYRITLLPGLADLRGNVSKAARSYVFSTGPTLASYGIVGRVFDWLSGMIAPGAVVEAVANPGTADSAIYIAVTDSLGQFEIGPLDAGRYLVRTFIDVDRNRERGVVEKWDSTVVTVTDHRPSLELLAAQRDTAPIGIQRAEALDSVWIRVDLDKPFDPRVTLGSSQVAVKRSDSTDVQVEAVMNEERAAALRQIPDTTTPRPTPTPTPTPPGGEVLSTRPPAARPSLPAPQRVLMVRVNPLTPLKTGERYTITVRALPNLLGKAGSGAAILEGPKPPARPPL